MVVINAALDQTGKWDQGELLRTKAKIQIAQGRLKKSVETYTLLLAVLQVQMKSFGAGKKHLKVYSCDLYDHINNSNDQMLDSMFRIVSS